MLDKMGAYHVWAGTVMRDQLAQLSEDRFRRDFDGHSAKSITQHILAALETCFFIADQSDDESVFARLETASKSQLLARWRELDQRLCDTLSSNPKGQITVPHITEQPFDIPAIEFYLQYIFHTIHHRGQLATVLRKLGTEVPGTDFLNYLANHQG